MAKTKLFKTVPSEELKNDPILVRMTKQDAEAIRYSAKIRQMTTSEFIRRAALGRKANVDYETEIVLALSDITRAIRELKSLHLAMVEHGIPPPNDDWRMVIKEVEAAILRIAK